MSVNSTASSVSSATASAQVSQPATAETSKKTSSDSSFKDEMDKVSTSEKKNDTDTQKTEEKHSEKVSEVNKSEQNNAKTNNDELKTASLSINDINSMLTDDIRQMMQNNLNFASNIEFNDLFSFSEETGMFKLDFTNSVNVSESDAQFFVELTKNEDINTQNIVAQAQTAIDGGAEFEQVQQNVKISQTLLNAINTARETNQPLRIDFDQNVAVILRMGKDGSFSANFIPGDKAVEQYLKNNLESLKATFDEKDLPYTDLSYSNRVSKQQKEQRRNRE